MLIRIDSKNRAIIPKSYSQKYEKEIALISVGDYAIIMTPEEFKNSINHKALEYSLNKNKRQKNRAICRRFSYANLTSDKRFTIPEQTRRNLLLNQGDLVDFHLEQDFLIMEKANSSSRIRTWVPASRGPDL